MNSLWDIILQTHSYFNLECLVKYFILLFNTVSNASTLLCSTQRNYTSWKPTKPTKPNHSNNNPTTIPQCIFFTRHTVFLEADVILVYMFSLLKNSVPNHLTLTLRTVSYTFRALYHQLKANAHYNLILQI